MFTYTADQITAAAEFYAEDDVTPEYNHRTGTTTWTFTDADRDTVVVSQNGSYIGIKVDDEALTHGEIIDFMEVAA